MNLTLGLIISGALFQLVAAKKDYNAPHPHTGLLPPYNPGPFQSLSLDKNDIQVLDDGKPVLKQTPPKDDEPTRGLVCIQDIQAPKDEVWAQILDLDSYVGKAPKVIECKNYCVTKNRDGTHNFKTKMAVRIIPGYSYASFYDLIYDEAKDSMTWKLDYEKTSDFDDVSGHWHLVDHPNKAGWTRGFYACDIKLKGAVPKLVVNYLSTSALKTATGWVKKESEKYPVKQSPVSSTSSAPYFVTIKLDKKALITRLKACKDTAVTVKVALNRSEIKTLNSGNDVAKEELKDAQTRASLAVLQVSEPPMLSKLEKIKQSPFTTFICGSIFGYFTTLKFENPLFFPTGCFLLLALGVYLADTYKHFGCG